jgi:hypothetical protein
MNKAMVVLPHSIPLYEYGLFNVFVAWLQKIFGLDVRRPDQTMETSSSLL